MNASEQAAVTRRASSRRARFAAVATLLVLSPVIGEVLSGATRLSYIFVLLPEIMVWGCGTLLIRELVRRWRGGWTSLLFLAFGLSIAEEFIIQQTSLAPLPFLAAAAGYGRVAGVNWPYFVFMLAYEAVWIVLIPIQVTELIFPEHRDEPWIGPRGMAFAGVVFLVGSWVAWFLWTQQARPNVFKVPIYHPPAVTLSLGVLAIVLLTATAFALRRSGTTPWPGHPPRPWVVVAVVMLLGFPWYLLMAVTFAPRPEVALWVPMLAASGWALLAFLVIRRWALASGWGDRHRWAICFGALVVCMLAGFLGAGAWTPADTIAKAAMNVLAVVAMVELWRSIARRSAFLGRGAAI